MSDLTEILQSADHALKRMLVAFQHMAHYMKNKTYISIVHSKAYEAVDSVQELFRLLAPHLQPVDCSLLKALVEATGVEQAIQRLNEYLHMTSSCLLGNSSKKVLTLQEIETWNRPQPPPQTQNGSKALVPHDSTNDVITSQPTSVPVTTVIAAEEMSWGTFRCIQSLLCGIFTVPQYALPYNDKKPGSVIVTCTTSLEMLSQIKSTLLDDGDMLLLLREKVVSIQVGKDYTIAVGNCDYWMVSNTPNVYTSTPDIDTLLHN